MNPPPGFKDTQETNIVTTVIGNSSSKSKMMSGVSGRERGGRQKFVPLMSAEGQSRATVQLPGRHTCQCLGQKHTLINNCVECGRIVCSQVCGVEMSLHCVWGVWECVSVCWCGV